MKLKKMSPQLKLILTFIIILILLVLGAIVFNSGYPFIGLFIAFVIPGAYLLVKLL